MKKAGISSVILPFLLLIANPVFAENITTGNSTAEVHVNTNIQSSSTNNSTSNVHTHIEVETNGDKKVLDEDGPGNYTVTSKSEDGGESSVNVTTNSGNNQTREDTSTQSADKDSKDSKDKDEKTVAPVSFLISIFQNVGGFFLRIFRNL